MTTPTDLSRADHDTANADARDDAASSNPRKRPRASRAGTTYTRKRAVTACELCRSRKVRVSQYRESGLKADEIHQAKCDNQQPCSTCVSFGANCVFKGRDNDYSAFDNASLAILERVNYAVQLLEQSARTGAVPVSQVNPLTDHFGVSPIAGIPSIGPSHTVQTPFSNTADAIDDVVTDKLSVNTRCACTHVLDWPVFEAIVQPSSVNPALYDEHSSPPTRHGDRAGVPSGRIDEGDLQGLVQAFLRNVHIKNPILEGAELLKLARVVAEEGFKWDGPSCLVLITCALGSISAAWQVAVPSGSESSLDDRLSHALADAYYTAARKRLGLLETSNQATQCWFLLGVFEMYAMRPLNAWASFSRACTLLEVRLYTQKQHNLQSFDSSERRLYWSCLKSEAELREEFDLPEPGLARVDHPYILPSPPANAMPEENGVDIDTAWETVHEQSWYYYLSDIAYRRITNRTMALLYNGPKEKWLEASIPRLYSIAEELDAQVLQWWATIPGSPTPACHSDTDELTYMLYLNYADLRERIWRPFVYIAVHSESSDHSALVTAGASKCVDVSFGMLENAVLKHRHHGCWQTIRCMLSKALVILAAARSRRIELKSDWKWRIGCFQQYIHYWEAEAPDLGAANRALSKLLATFDGE